MPFGVLGWRVVGPLWDNSFLWHVRAGTLQLDRGEVLRTDPFSFTAFGESWRTQSWLLELGYGFLERLTGTLQWVPTMMFLILGGTLGFVGLAVYRVTREPARTGFVLAALAWVGMLFVMPRPAALSFLLLASVVVVLGHPERLGWVLMPLFWLWASVHGLFAIGLGLIALEAIRTRSRRLFVLGLLGGGATLLTAHGAAVITILVDFLQNREALALLSEWKRPDFFSLRLAPALLVAFALGVGFASRRLRWRDAIVVIPFLLIGALQLRSVFPALIVLIPYAAVVLSSDKTRAARDRGSRLVNNALAVTIILLGLIGLARPIGRSKALPPDDAVAALREPMVFHGLSAGGLLIWAEYPERRVFVDDRAELYGVERFEAVVATIDGTSGTKLLDRLALDEALVKTSWELDEVLADEGWLQTYRDDDWAVYRRP